MNIQTWIVLCCVVCSSAQSRAGAQESASNRADCQLRVATGKRGKIFSKMLRDIRSLCGSQVQLCEVESEGGLQNTNALSTNEADLGFVQIDTLQAMKQSDENIAALQAVLPVNSNLLHILARREGFIVQGERSFSTLWRREDKTVVIGKLSDLKGLPVAVVGSAQLLGRMLDRTFGCGWHFVDLATDEQAIAAVKAGEVAAALFMSGWPSGSVDAVARDTSLSLVAYDLPAQTPYQLVRKNYPKLGVFYLPFLAAPNLLVTRPFKPDGTRGQLVATLQQCIVSNLVTLQEGAFEPGWKEIKNPNEVYGWERFGSTPVSTAKR